MASKTAAGPTCLMSPLNLGLGEQLSLGQRSGVLLDACDHQVETGTGGCNLSRWHGGVVGGGGLCRHGGQTGRRV